jgi:Flp pilus assembly protein CpaB
LIAFLMAAVLAGIITYFFSQRMRLSRSQHATSKIVAAAGDLPSGATLTTKDVTTVDWPSNMLMAGSFDKVEDVVGKPLLYPVSANEPILKRELGLEGWSLIRRLPPVVVQVLSLRRSCKTWKS